VDFGASHGFQLLHLIFNLVLAEHLHFGQSRAPTPPHLSLVAPFVGSIMVVQGGVLL
jgi:hypothetical protein